MGFKASVQYNDWVGTAAADDLDQTSFGQYLEEKGLMGEDEFLLNIRLWVGENLVHRPGIVSAQALAFKGSGYDKVSEEIASSKEPIRVRRIDVELTIEQFSRMFKRFAVSLTPRGLDLSDTDYREVER